MNPEMCPCGLPLHYKNSAHERIVRDMIKAFGPNVIVHVDGRAWNVPRHYIALHGLKARELEGLGFPEIK